VGDTPVIHGILETDQQGAGQWPYIVSRDHRMDTRAFKGILDVDVFNACVRMGRPDKCGV
jgi:hypothetical protein